MRVNLSVVLLSLVVLSAAGPASAGPMDGVWVGEYVCAQGKTALALTFKQAPAGARVLFQFSGTAANPKAPKGSFEMVAGADPFSGVMTFKPVRWVHQPPGYRMVGLKGKMHGKDTIMGDVVGAPGCTTFMVQRGAGAFAGTFTPEGFTGSVQGEGGSISVQLGAPGAPTMGATVQVDEGGMDVDMPGMKMTARVNAGGQPPVMPAPTTNINVTITETKTAVPQPFATAAPETCRSVLLARGHASTSLIHCDDDVNQACAVALLKAGHSPTALIHCEDISNPACAVQLLQSGRNPTEIIHCD